MGQSGSRPERRPRVRVRSLALVGLLALACDRGPADDELVRAAYRDYRAAIALGDLGYGLEDHTVVRHVMLSFA